MKQPSKRAPTRKELGQLLRVYGGTPLLVFEKNGAVTLRRQRQ